MNGLNCLMKMISQYQWKSRQRRCLGRGYIHRLHTDSLLNANVYVRPAGLTGCTSWGLSCQLLTNRLSLRVCNFYSLAATVKRRVLDEFPACLLRISQYYKMIILLFFLLYHKIQNNFLSQYPLIRTLREIISSRKSKVS